MKTKIVKNSIWLMLPVSIAIVYVINFFVGEMSWQTLWMIPFAILTYGAIIWLPSMLMTYLLESFLIDESANSKRVIIVFGIETALTFAIIGLLFGYMTWSIPLLALAMSILIQASRFLFIQIKLKKFQQNNMIRNQGAHLHVLKP